MTHLFERALSVSFDVRNIGKEDGHEVSQLYLGFPSAAGEPPKVLRGFNRSFIGKKDTASIMIELNNKAISVW
jgi:beta-glucosidase